MYANILPRAMRAAPRYSMKALSLDAFGLGAAAADFAPGGFLG
jgi:hypothetical protein